MFFRIKRSTQLRKLMTAYCDRQSVDLNSIAFLFDGRRLRGDQTPDEVNFFFFFIFLFLSSCTDYYFVLSDTTFIPGFCLYDA